MGEEMYGEGKYKENEERVMFEREIKSLRLHNYEELLALCLEDCK